MEYSLVLRNSLDGYLEKLVTILNICATLESGFCNALTQDFNYWQIYRSEAMTFFNAVNAIHSDAIRAIDVLDNIRHANEKLKDGD